MFQYFGTTPQNQNFIQDEIKSIDIRESLLSFGVKFLVFQLAIQKSNERNFFLSCGALNRFRVMTSPCGVSRSHSDTSQPIGLLWMSDQPVAGNSTWQNTTLTIDKHPCLRRNSNPQFQQANSGRPTLYISRSSAAARLRYVERQFCLLFCMGVKLGLSLGGRKVGWWCWRVVCWGNMGVEKTAQWGAD